MKKILITVLFVAAGLSMTLIYSCKKKEDTATNNPTNPTTASPGANNETFSDDANFSKTENDQINSDINADLNAGNGSGMRRSNDGMRFQSYGAPCGCNHVDTNHVRDPQPYLVYYFDGTTDCGGRKRSGQITVTLISGTRWVDAGAVVSFSTTNFKVTRTHDNKWIMFQGTKTLKNVYGSDFVQWLNFLGGKATLKVQERALGVNVTFSGGSTAVWNSAAVGEWSVDTIAALHPVYYAATGDTSMGGYNNISNWGTNRFGQYFVTHFTTGRPLTWNTNCGAWKPVNGQWTHEVNASQLKVTYGVNSDGSQYTGSSCPWGWSIAWVLPNSNGSANFAYW